MFKNLFSLTKPGIIFGNLITVCAGFFLASRGSINITLLLGVAVGISLIVASGCVFNNCIDIDIDCLMKRTQNRVLVRGLISKKVALIYGVILGIFGILTLYFLTNNLAVYLALVGLFVYVVIYSLWLKRASSFGTLIGSISGAMPPVVGYVAVTNRLDLGALILFLILSIWQMPHSYAIAIYRLSDYTKANIPVLPVKKGIHATKISMLIYIILFTLVTPLLTCYHYLGYSYVIAVMVGNIWWIILSIKGFYVVDDQVWAKKMFMFSVIYITLWSVLVSISLG